MSNIFFLVDQCMKLVGENWLELLFFWLGIWYIYVINVFKVKEVIIIFKLNIMFGVYGNLCGVIVYRGFIIFIIDLWQVIYFCVMNNQFDMYCNVIIIEYNCLVQGFMIGDVVRIVNMFWGNI